MSDVEERLKQLQEEGDKLRQMQEDLEKESAVTENKEDVDARSVYVGNVEYQATPADLEKHFRPCGNINRVNIMLDKFSGHPKGYAYIEFAEPSLVTSALLLSGTEFFGREIKVLPKRTNLPGQTARGRGRGRGRGRFRGGSYRGRGYRPY